MKPTEATTFVVQVHPNAARNSILGFRGEVLHVRISAPPVEGKANRELVEFLSDRLGVSKSRISIERGAASRLKTIAVTGLERAQVETLLG